MFESFSLSDGADKGKILTPAVEAAANKPEAALDATAIHEAMKDDKAFPLIENIVRAMPVGEKARLIAALDMVEKKIESEGAMDITDYILLTMNTVGGVAAIVLWILFGLAAVAPAAAMLGVTMPALAGINNPDEAMQKKLEVLRALLK